jgi:hypothetical protein
LTTDFARRAAVIILQVAIAVAPASRSAFGQSAPAPAAADPDAMKKIAATVPNNLDILGIKLGMTPQQATAAIKAANPNLKIEILTTRLERPGIPNFTRVPRWMVAHNLGATPNSFRRKDGSAEVIGIEFTTPPSHSVVAKIVRQVTFPTDQPVMASNLIDALHKKYGEDENTSTERVWVFDATGKPITGTLPSPQNSCLPVDPAMGVPIQITAYDPAQDYGGIALGSTQEEQSAAERRGICTPFTFVDTYNLGENMARNALQPSMIVALQSPVLLYSSLKATHDWLQAQADALAKQKEAAGAKRAAPKL